VHNTAPKTATSSRKQTRERAKHAARWACAYADAKPSVSLVGRMFDVPPTTVAKAIAHLRNGANGSNGHAPPPPPTVDTVARWWFAATDADRVAFIHAVGIEAVWCALIADLR